MDDHDSQASDRLGAARPAKAPERLPDSRLDFEPAIGYEAADPSLVAPQWLELHASSDEP